VVPMKKCGRQFCESLGMNQTIGGLRVSAPRRWMMAANASGRRQQSDLPNEYDADQVRTVRIGAAGTHYTVHASGGQELAEYDQTGTGDPVWRRDRARRSACTCRARSAPPSAPRR
jgi:hypothetical protein